MFVGTSDKPLRLLQKEFPDLHFIRMKGYDITYPANSGMTMHMLLSAPRIISRINKEHKLLQKIIEKHNIHGVISDNRYGLYSEKVPTAFLTHQLFIKAPLGEKFIRGKTENYISKYTECWIPDFEGENNLSGDLSHGEKIPPNTKYIGPLSRFNKPDPDETKKNKYDIMAVLSGPEPQRSILESIILEQFKKTRLRCLVVRGLTDEKLEFLVAENIEVLPHLETNRMLEEMMKSELIITRSGYTSIMDLTRLGKNAVLIPTPGQTEQEYLAAYHKNQGHFFSMNQQEFNIQQAINKSMDYEGFLVENDGKLLKETISEFLKKTGDFNKSD